MGSAISLHPNTPAKHLCCDAKIPKVSAIVETGLYGGVKEIVTFGKHLPLDERLLRIDHIQARRYSKLTGVAMGIATEGIVRHLRACDRMDVNPDTSAVREIIDDALNGRRVFAESTDQTRAA